MPSNAEKAERAKIFAPYDALKGYRNFLNKKEKIIVSRMILMEDACEMLDLKIHQVQLGAMIQVIYYDGEHYLSKEGMVSKMDLEYQKTIQIVQTVIPIKDIVDIKGEGIED